MPSSAENSFAQGEYNANARYRSTRHHHGHRYRPRHVRNITIPVRNSDVSSAPEVATTNIGPFDGNYQPPVRWTDVDVSTVLKPSEWINFPPDPGSFKLPADPPVVKEYQYNRGGPLYTFALLVMLTVVGSGVCSELIKARTYHKADAKGLGTVGKRPPWMPQWVWRRREALSKLT